MTKNTKTAIALFTSILIGQNEHVVEAKMRNRDEPATKEQPTLKPLKPNKDITDKLTKLLTSPAPSQLELTRPAQPESLPPLKNFPPSTERSR